MRRAPSQTKHTHLLVIIAHLSFGDSPSAMSERLIFRADFDESPLRTKHPIILQSADGICFRFCLTTLFKHLPFFAHAATRRRTCSGNGGPLLVLSSATATAVNFLLCMVMAIEGTHTLDRPILTLRPVKELVHLATVYDLYEMVPMMASVYKMDDWTQLALAAATNNERLAVALGQQIYECGSRISDIPPFAREILEDMGKAYMQRVVKLEKKRSWAWQSLRQRMVDQPMDDGTEDFTKDCRETRCATFNGLPRGL